MNWRYMLARFIIATCCLTMTQCELEFGDGTYHDILVSEHDEFTIDFGIIDLAQSISGSSKIVQAPPRLYVFGFVVSLPNQSDCDKDSNIELANVFVSLSVQTVDGKAVSGTRSRLGDRDWTWTSSKQHTWIWQHDVVHGATEPITQEGHACLLYIVAGNGSDKLRFDQEYIVTLTVEEPASRSLTAKLLAVTADSGSF